MASRVLGSIGSFCLGAALSYVFDPECGRRRRALIQDKVRSAACAASDALDTTSRDVANRTRGLVAGIRSRSTHEEVDDAVLAERVRARLGTVGRHPRSIDVSVENGRVTLRGLILAEDVDRVVRCVAGVRGVREVDNRLEVHAEAGDIPGLQGAPPPRRGGRFELMQVHWSPAARLLAGVTGGALAAYGVRLAGLVGSALAGTGAVLLARAATNLELRRLFGIGAGRDAVVVQKTLEVAAPVEAVYALWRRYEEFPRFMSHVREVRRVSTDRSRWTVAGPAGVPVEWETVVTRDEPNRLLAWETVPGSTVRHAGVVRFERTRRGSTRVHVRLSYSPPAGAAGHAIALVLGADPRRALDDDLLRLKSLLEDRVMRAHGQSVTLEEPA